MQSLQLALQLKKELSSVVVQLLCTQQQFLMAILDMKAMQLSVSDLLQKLAKSHFVGLQKMLAKKVMLLSPRFAL